MPGSVTPCALATTRPGIAPIASCAIYSLTVCGLLGVSALHHRLMWTPRGHQVMRRLDRSLIFLFIAGTYTNPWPSVFGHHEFFHACTLVAAICHHIAVYFALYS